MGAAVFETISSVYQNLGVGVSVTVPAPAGLQTGELMVVQGITNASFGLNGPVIFPAGWTQLDQTNPAIGNPIGFMGFKIAVLADLGASFIFSHSGASLDEWDVGILRLSNHGGVDTFGVIDVNDAPGVNPPFPGFTTVADNVLVVRFAGWENTTTEPTSTGPAAGHTTRAQEGGPFDPGTLDPNGIWATRNTIVTPPGSVGAAVVPQDGVGNTRAVCYSLGIAPATSFPGELLNLGLIEDQMGGEIILPILEATMRAEQVRLCDTGP